MDNIGFMAVKKGDRVRRLLGGQVPMDLTVTHVDGRLIYAGAELNGAFMGWTFDRATGIEEDEGLGWGVRHGKSGSRLVEIL